LKNGVLLVDKPTGISSARALYPVKRRFPRRKIGHTGTLDPFASGLLVVLVGYATRLSRFFLSMDKRYTATVVFGVETDTLDPEGTVVARAAVPPEDRVRTVVPGFHGTIQQVPPRYSALKVRGTRAYRAARAGEAFTLPPRPVTVYEIGIDALPAEDQPYPSEAQSPPTKYSLDVHCGSGTYIRSLARDIGHVAGSVASLVTLRRTRVGPFSVDPAVTTDQLDSDIELPAGSFLSVAEAVRGIPGIAVVSVSDAEDSQLGNGGRISDALTERAVTVASAEGSTHLLCVTENDRPVALLERDGTGLSYTAVFPADEEAR